MNRVAIGGLPSLVDNEETMLSPLTIGDVAPLWFAANNQSWATLVPLMQKLTDRDVKNLYVGDLTYIALWLRKISSTEVARYATWDCHALAPYKNGILQNSDQDREKFKTMSRTKLLARGIEFAECGKSSTASIENYRQKTKVKTIDLEHPLTYPKVYRYLEDEYEHEFADLLFWIDAPDHKTAASIFESLDISIIEKIQEAQRNEFGVTESYQTACQWCNDEVKVTKKISLFSTLKIIDPKSMMNMRYNLGSTNIHISESTPLINLIFWHNQYKKDKDEAEEQRRLQNAKTR